MNQIFSEHAMEILGNPIYKNWREIEKGKPGSGIMTIGPDSERVLRKWKIIPSDNYPEIPPIVVVEPRLLLDCRKDGTLPYTNYLLEKNKYKYTLKFIINELIQTFHIAF